MSLYAVSLHAQPPTARQRALQSHCKVFPLGIVLCVEQHVKTSCKITCCIPDSTRLHLLVPQLCSLCMQTNNIDSDAMCDMPSKKKMVLCVELTYCKAHATLGSATATAICSSLFLLHLASAFVLKTLVLSAEGEGQSRWCLSCFPAPARDSGNRLRGGASARAGHSSHE